ncbi:Reverse transcriptase (RNA-dependent DNA polymerase) [Nesidiocoris tenuis]|uniref:Reverse transcriptase (RNA-dependent DNA polymerase) n=1 Tax=Nesidiocoris tenuis TaxID=355587 RepID=A0ABN7AGN7_9HEMI|nr:Reverse transcriptase (RNA-dependent DNA polymerase) [Nesidiocoris tenuis]
MMEIVDKLFPDHQERGEDMKREVGDIPPFTTAELKATVRSLRRNRAPGPNGLPSEVVKVVVEECPTLLLNLYNACLHAGIFSSQWKTARLVLIDEGKGDGSVASSLRSLCMHHSWDIGLLVTPDVKNAFNSARWVDFVDALQNKFGEPEYLMRVMRDYIRGRKL